MSSEQSEILEKVIFVALIISLFADTFLRAFWNKAYFTFGIPIFVMRISVNKKYEGVPHQYLLEKEFQSDWFMPALTFKANDSCTFFFREEFLGTPIKLRYLALMHGLIIFEHDKKQVIVKGIANWFLLWIILYFVLEWLNLSVLSPVQITDSTIVILLAGIFYSMQYFRFSKVCKFAAEICSNKVFLNSGRV